MNYQNFKLFFLLLATLGITLATSCTTKSTPITVKISTAPSMKKVVKFLAGKDIIVTQNQFTQYRGSLLIDGHELNGACIVYDTTGINFTPYDGINKFTEVMTREKNDSTLFIAATFITLPICYQSDADLIT
ncbi:MAG: hypothetical protein P8P30_03660 [Rickettsiales bacterium]|nr:hypothetical protein [Rickettsiales bacterium]